MSDQSSNNQRIAKNIMDKSISILNQDYILWVEELVKRYRCSQIKASIKVNRELVHYYWELGKDIEEKQVDNKYGSKFYATLSRDLRHEIPDAEGLSETSIRYARRFYLLYNQCFEKLPQVVEESDGANLPQVVENLYTDLFSIPWGHHRYIIDKCSNDADKALFFVRQTLSNGWSRDVLLNALSTNLYERSGKALTNFKHTLPDIDSDLAQELTRDPYDFSFTGLRGRYNERILKDTLAQYALESSSQPLGISEYELEKLYPERVEGTMPSIKEIEAKLKDVDKVNEH